MPKREEINNKKEIIWIIVNGAGSIAPENKGEMVIKKIKIISEAYLEIFFYRSFFFGWRWVIIMIIIVAVFIHLCII